MGIGEAAGMFPIDSSVHTWDARMLEQFDALTAEKGFSWKLKEILPEVLVAGEDAGALTEEGAALLDPDGDLCAGIPMCLRRETREPEWQRPTVWRCAREMYLPERAYLQWRYWNSRCQSRMRRSIW